VRACLQVDGAAGGEVTAGPRPLGARSEHLLGERREDHVDHGHLQRPADEAAAKRVGREVANAMGLHSRLLEQPPVDRELPVCRIL
jgi:hypothetical protein